jgi:hypothetical protein
LHFYYILNQVRLAINDDSFPSSATEYLVIPFAIFILNLEYF